MPHLSGRRAWQLSWHAWCTPAHVDSLSDAVDINQLAAGFCFPFLSLGFQNVALLNIFALCFLFLCTWFFLKCCSFRAACYFWNKNNGILKVTRIFMRNLVEACVAIKVVHRQCLESSLIAVLLQTTVCFIVLVLAFFSSLCWIVLILTWLLHAFSFPWI